MAAERTALHRQWVWLLVALALGFLPHPSSEPQVLPEVDSGICSCMQMQTVYSESLRTGQHPDELSHRGQIHRGQRTWCEDSTYWEARPGSCLTLFPEGHRLCTTKVPIPVLAEHRSVKVCTLNSSARSNKPFSSAGTLKYHIERSHLWLWPHSLWYNCISGFNTLMQILELATAACEHHSTKAR